ncbi:MAG: hypothetical protein LUD72_02640 [Bacteroidales bacterium]|nr:hypothetical protein [Bacteroidales bacterium]
MSFKQICDTIFRLYLYADTAKMVHYSTPSNHGHELADEIRNAVMKFADEIAEQIFGFYGKPKYSDMTVKLDVVEEEDLNRLCQHVVDTVEPLRQELLKNDKLSGTVSLIDDFKGEMGKMAFLGTFDRISTYKLKK